MIGGSNKLISMREAADFLGLSYKGFAASYKAMRIPCFKVGRSVKFRIRDLESWLEGKRVA